MEESTIENFTQLEEQVTTNFEPQVTGNIQFIQEYIKSFSFSQLNSLDYIILFLVFAISYASARKGFIREIKRTAPLLLAVLFTYGTAESIQQEVMSIVHIKIISTFISYILFFIVLYTLFNYIMNMILSDQDQKIKSKLNTLLGLGVGFVKVMTILVILTYFANSYLFIEEQPDLLKGSWLKVIFDNTINLLV